jgi:hypothetical protein
MTTEYLPMGIYRHYKGPLYLVLGLAHDANADVLGWDGVILPREDVPLGHSLVRVIPLEQRTVVVYMALQLDGAHLGPRMAVRTLADFVGTVEGGPNDGDIRFSYLGPVLTQEMLDLVQEPPT